MTATVELLRALVARGITQTEIRRRTGIPQPRLSKWAAGKAPTGADDALKLKALADELGVASAQASATGEASHAS